MIELSLPIYEVKEVPKNKQNENTYIIKDYCSVILQEIS